MKIYCPTCGDSKIEKLANVVNFLFSPPAAYIICKCTYCAEEFNFCGEEEND